jgi:hypothetical protein
LPLGSADSSLDASIQSLLNCTSLTSEILHNFIIPIDLEVARNSYAVRYGTALKLSGVQ